MLTVTHTGLVASPDTLQVRVGRSVSSHLRAGAPRPTRAMTDAEVLEAVRAFTEGRRGPRTRPVRSLVLSGLGGARDAAVRAVADLGPTWGIEHLTLHQPSTVSAPGVDAVVVAVRRPSDLDPLVAWSQVHRAAVLPLDGVGLRALPTLLPHLRAAAPDRVVLTWPFPPAGRPAPPHEVVAVLDRVGAELDASGLVWSLKGLPACLAGAHADRCHRSRNRWYVDADHPASAPLLFVPDVMQWHKDEGCRFCTLDARCDGVARDWWSQGRCGPLRPR